MTQKPGLRLALTAIMLQASKVTNRKHRCRKCSEQEGMLKAERLPLLRGLLCIIVAPSRDSGTAVGNLIALIRIDGHMKDLMSDWDMLVMALFYSRCTCLSGPRHRIEQLYSRLKFSYLKIARHKRRFRFSAGVDQHSNVD